jgi:hypothetical protein
LTLAVEAETENTGKTTDSLVVGPVKEERKLGSNFDPSKQEAEKENALSSGRIGMQVKSD